VSNSLDRGETRALVWEAVGHGADCVAFWQWRSALNGQEQYHGTLLGADGSPVPLYPEVARTGAELDRLAPLLAGTHVQSEVALLHSYEARWAMEWQPQSSRFDPLEELKRYYAPLRQAVQSIDIVPPDVDLSQYKLVIAPALNLITAKQAQNLAAYVKSGGNLVLTPRSGMKDDDNALWPQLQPGPLAELLGAEVKEFYALASPIDVNGLQWHTQATIWGELLHVSAPDTQVVLRYGKANGWLDDQPAMITRRVGKGSITYIATIFDADAMRNLTAWMLQTSHVSPATLVVPPGVEASVRYGPRIAVHILVNLSGREQTVKLPSRMKDEFSGHPVTELTLPVSGVAVLSEGR
jgi:beta-galactosidase